MKTGDKQNMLTSPMFEDRLFFPTTDKKTPKCNWATEALPAKEALKKWPNEKHWAMKAGQGLAVVDVDIKNGGNEEDVYTLGFPRNTYRVQTPSGGCHLYYQDPDHLLEKNSVQLLGKGIDTRVEGGYICCPPMPGYKVTCDHTPISIKGLSINIPQKVVSPAPMISCDEIIPEGSRNQTLLNIAAKMRRVGLGENEISAAVYAASSNRCSSPLPQKQLDDIVRSALKLTPDEIFYHLEFKKAEDGNIAAEKSGGLRMVDAKTVEDRDGEAEEEFIWRQHIPQGEATLLYAEGGMGKSTMSLLISKDIMDHNKDAKICWIACEGNRKSTRVQMRNIGFDMSRFFFLERADTTTTCDFSNQLDLDDLDMAMETHRPSLVVIDSLREMSNVDINSKNIGSVMKSVQMIVCEKYHASLIYIHHETKGDTSARNKSLGSNTIMAQVRVALRMTEGSDNNRRFVTVEKSNLSSKPSPLMFIQVSPSEFSFQETGTDNPEIGQPMDLKVGQTIKLVLQGMFSLRKSYTARECYEAVSKEIQPPPMSCYVRKVRDDLNIRWKQESNTWVWYVDNLLTKSTVVELDYSTGEPIAK
jgi:archaellum biogenesis ATPase FlaH